MITSEQGEHDDVQVPPVNVCACVWIQALSHFHSENEYDCRFHAIRDFVTFHAADFCSNDAVKSNTVQHNDNK